VVVYPKKEKHLGPLEKLYSEFGDIWVWIAFDPRNKIVVAFVAGKRQLPEAEELLQKVFTRTDTTTPFFTSDELKHYKDALLKVYGVQEVVEPTGKRGRPRKPKVHPVEDLDYAVVHKERKKGRVVRVTTRVVFGSPERIEQKLENSPVSSHVNTSFVERNNLSIRAGGARFTRKSLCFSKRKKLLIDFLNIYFGYYHLCRPHRGCSNDGEKRTPFMSAGFTDHIWTIKEVMNYKI